MLLWRKTLSPTLTGDGPEPVVIDLLDCGLFDCAMSWSVHKTLKEQFCQTHVDARSVVHALRTWEHLPVHCALLISIRPFP